MGYVILITTTGNYVTRRGTDTVMVFGNEWAANNHIEIYKLNKNILRVIPNPARLPAMNEVLD
jgi:hypothetical protein